MLSASFGVKPNETVAKLSFRWTRKAPPVALFATKSVEFVTGDVFSPFLTKHTVLACFVYELDPPPLPQAAAVSASAAMTAKRLTARQCTAPPGYGRPHGY